MMVNKSASEESKMNPSTDDLNPLNIFVTQKSKPTIASTNLQYTASTHDHTQTLELNHTPKNISPAVIPFVSSASASALNSMNLERDFPVEVMAPDSLHNTPLQSPAPAVGSHFPHAKAPLVKKQRLVRTYSETETTNFSSSTGVRVFDDSRHRPYHGYPSTRRVSFTKNRFASGGEAQQNGDVNDENINNRSYIHYTSEIADGLEDEYIPDFNFGNNLLSKWFDEDEDLEVYGHYETDAKKRKLELHTDLTPISVPEPVVKNDSNADKATKIDLNSLQSLPDNFKTLPFSQRKKILMNIYPNYSYSELTNLIRSYVKTNSNSNASLNKLSTKSSSSSIAASYLSNMRVSQQEFDVNKKGAVVLGHELMDIVGRGAWGVIRECKSVTDDGELRAIKIISVQNEKVKNIFMNEVFIWSLMDHPRILPLMDFKETASNVFALTKLNYGGTLFELTYTWGHVSQGTIAVKDRESLTLVFIRQIAEAIKYMHEELAIVHGDLKLENVLVDKDNNVMVCDFGMAKIYVPDDQRPQSLRDKVHRFFHQHADFYKSAALSQPSSAGSSASADHDARQAADAEDGIISITALNGKVLGPSLASTTLKPVPDNTDASASGESALKVPDKHIGSLPYAAPELLAAEVALSPAQDLWSMGVLIYTMLIGDLPFKHNYEPRLRMMILHGKYDKELLVKHYGDDSKLVAAVLGCLHHDTVHRWKINDLIDNLA